MNILEQLKREIEQGDWTKLIKQEGKEDKQNDQED